MKQSDAAGDIALMARSVTSVLYRNYGIGLGHVRCYVIGFTCKRMRCNSYCCYAVLHVVWIARPLDAVVFFCNRPSQK